MNLRFSFISSQNLLKSRIFSTNIMGLYFPDSRVEQARFSPLTTCLTTCGEIIDILLQLCYNIFAKFKGAKCVWRV